MAKSTFNKEFLLKIKTLLLKEKEILEKDLGKFTQRNFKVSGDYNSNFPEYGDKDDENANEVAEYAAELPLEESFEKTLRDNVQALKRLEEGTYGICKYCKKPIDEKRLVARPTSNACVSCKKAITQEI
ncbi:MAG: hypothetical protein A2537_00300 [Candidatus Magasanikbacteria bacterium RIFOXYD2_FULL_36_9]|uniref:Zinc finger DksA/TraR C4-type domain-containing protein n=1 Tax=Candidatus Magasanikbacteria bacterium RIFOXYD2_FULL_36_9 TaxID=1798707 RepID=A0A1F6NXE9_9BACT|nr:MAG: hypothetical protein A2537_00300 [Candidatus Magasanikbacteria bacterium RIFOXYD2_FULL_36_9]